MGTLNINRYPSPNDNKDSVIWDGEFFIVEGISQSVLNYSHNTNAGWEADNAENILVNMQEEGVIGKESRRNVIQQLKDNYKVNDKFSLLEVGCFQGALLEDIKKDFTECEIVGVEYDRNSLDYIVSKNLQIPLLCFDLSESILPNERFDVIVALNVIEHIKDDNNALAQCYRMLKPGGLIILEVPAGEKLYDSYDKYVGHYRRYDMSGFISLVENNSFSITMKTHLVFLAYPLFWLSKMINNRKVYSDNDGQELVRNRIALANNNIFLNISLKIDKLIRKFFYIPYGVRCVLIGVKH
jgi:SAM-dependent methyltransferase